jgi:hypothetical protein
MAEEAVDEGLFWLPACARCARVPEASRFKKQANQVGVN